MKKQLAMPSDLTYWRADQVAECVSGITDALYARLWQIQIAASNPTPLGGDGTNGTVETPDAQLDLLNDDKSGHWWAQLSRAEQSQIAGAFQGDQS